MIHSAAFWVETGMKTASGHRLIYTCGEAATTLLNLEP